MEHIFNSSFFLKFKNGTIEESFKTEIHKMMLRSNKWICLFLFCLSLIDSIYESFIYEEAINKQIGYIGITIYTSYVLTVIFLIETIFVFNCENYKFHVFLSYANYAILAIPFTNLREVLFSLNKIEKHIFALIRALELLLRVGWVLLLLDIFPMSIIMNILFLIVISIYVSIIDSPMGIIYYLSIIVLILLISYFYSKVAKNIFYINYNMKHQNKWYSNLFERMNSGFISFRNDKIEVINNFLLEVLYKTENVKELVKKNCSSVNKSNIKSNRNSNRNSKYNSFIANSKNENFRNEDNIIINCENKSNYIVKDHSDKILNMLLSDIHVGRKNLLDSIFSHEIKKPNFNLKEFKSEFERLYNKQEMDEKFLFIGYKDLEIEENGNNDNQNEYPQQDASETLENENLHFKKEKELLSFEVFFRCFPKTDEDDEGSIEIIFNDITKSQKTQEKNAELKYKMMFLSKIAHEFKNPLICISELIDQYYDKANSKERSVSLVDYNNNDHHEHLQKIKSLSDYLLIMIKDLNYFAHTHLKEEPPLEKNETNLKELLFFCEQIADVLLYRFDRNAVKFKIDSDFSKDFTFHTDSVKLKQVLLNLISNSVKCTNSGSVSLKIKKKDVAIAQNSTHNTNNNTNNNTINNCNVREFICFEISDTGIGISDDQMCALYQPFNKGKGKSFDNKHGSGLGLCIVAGILKQFRTKLEISSKLGVGSSFRFDLEIENVLNSPLNNREIPIDQIEKFFKLNNIINTERVDTASSTSTLRINDMRSIHPSDKQIIKNLKQKIPTQNSTRSLPGYVDYVPFSSNNLMYKPELQIDCDIKKYLSYIIITDDEKLTRMGTARIVNKIIKRLKINAKVIEAEDGIECLNSVYKLLKEGLKVSLIISDEMMNYMNGSTCAELFKKVKKLKCLNIPFCIISALPEMRSNYVRHFVSKPLNEKEAEMIISSIDWI